jgi:hypothetical protein
MEILNNAFIVIWIAIGAVLIYFQNRLFNQIKEDYPEKWKSLGKPSISRAFEAAEAPPWEHFGLMKEMFATQLQVWRYMVKGDVILDSDPKILSLKRLNQGGFLFAVVFLLVLGISDAFLSR